VARILAVTVAYESDAPGDLQPTLIGLPELRRHCRAERVEDLIDDLVMLCRDSGYWAEVPADSPGARAWR
jgi:hypothetical protein